MTFSILENLGLVFLRASLEGTLLVGVVLGIQWALRSRLSPGCRAALWWVVAGRLVLLVSFSSPASLFNWVPTREIAGAAGTAPGRMSAERPVLAVQRPVLTVESGASAGGAAPDGREAGSRGISETSAAGTALAPRGARGMERGGDSASGGGPGARALGSTVPDRAERYWLWVLTGVWAAGAGIFLGHMLRHAARMGREFRALPGLSDPAVCELFRECCRRAGVAGDLRVVESASLPSPALYGFWRPILILPKGLGRRLSVEQLRFVFLHELGHVKRRDVAVNCAVALIQVLHWFNPVIWHGFARWRTDRELACDALALEAAGAERNLEYGRTLLELAAGAPRRLAAPLLAGILEDRRHLHKRIAMISAFVPRRRGIAGPLVLGSCLAITTLTDPTRVVLEAAAPAAKGEKAPSSKPAVREDAWAALGSGEEFGSNLIFRLRAGGEAWSQANSEAGALREILAMPATKQLREQAMDKIGGAVARRLGGREGALAAVAGAKDETLRALWDQVFQVETCLELMEDPAGSGPAWRLGLRLGAEQAASWTPRLKLWLEQKAKLAVSRREMEGRPGWAAALRDKAGQFRFAQAGDWLALEMGDEGALSKGGFLGRLTRTGPTGTLGGGALMQAQIDLARLAKLGRLDSGADLPRLVFQMKGQGAGLRTEGRMLLARPPGWTLQPWRLPKNAVKDPLISFTAAQGLAGFLKDQSWYRHLQPGPGANQAFFWGNSPNVLLQVFAAFPVGNVQETLRRFQDRVVPPANEKLLGQGLGSWQPAPAAGAWHWRGLPYIIPFLQPAPDKEFLLAGLVPLARSPFTNAAPPELWAQFGGRTNLIYYDWEITQPRMMQLRELTVLLPLMTTLTPMPRDASVFRWLDAIEPKLGETITEITRLDDREWKLARKGHLGLNAIELLALAQWLHSPDFPSMDFRVGLRPAPSPKK